jgi:subtilase family serine protease
MYLRRWFAAWICVCVTGLVTSAGAQQPKPAMAVPDGVPPVVQSAKGAGPVASTVAPLPQSNGTVTVSGGVPPIVRVAKDLGPVESTLRYDRLHLLLARPANQAIALEQELAELHNPDSQQFHQWLTAAEFGEKYGVTEEQERSVTNWLTSNGFEVNGIDTARMIIEFSGMASQVESAFGTQIHSLQVGTETHISNIGDLRVPAQIAAAITGVSLSDFKPHPLLVNARSVKRQANGKFLPISASGHTAPDLTVSYDGGELQLVTPADFATIYNLTPAWNAGYRGAGQTIAVLEDSLINAPDVATFRKQFGLTQYAGTFTQTAPAGSHPCTSPGVTSDADEATLDAQWAGSTAPDANIILAACADTRTQFGGLTALQNLLVARSVPKIVSLSYGECEAEMGTTELAEFNQTFQQAVAEGVSVFVSSGDSGSAVCDPDTYSASHALASSGFATTPYNTAVGGTDFFDFFQGTTSTYWSETNSPTFESALSYVPEMTWNNSCADSALLTYVGVAVAYGPSGYCNNDGYNYQTTAAASGGFSTVYSKPSWQDTYGVPQDGARDVPDISLFAASGFYGHALVYCDTQGNKYPCNFSNAEDAVYNTAGGTSFAAPSMAGIFALIDQKYGVQGNANIPLYALADLEYGTQSSPISSTLTSCNSTNGNQVDPTCYFRDVTEGSIDVPCFSALNCYGANATEYLVGAMSVSNAQFEPAYPAATGWDYATGIGSLNATMLLDSWSKIMPKTSVSPTLNRMNPLSPLDPLPTQNHFLGAK